MGLQIPLRLNVLTAPLWYSRGRTLPSRHTSHEQDRGQLRTRPSKLGAQDASTRERAVAGSRACNVSSDALRRQRLCCTSWTRRHNAAAGVQGGSANYCVNLELRIVT